MARNKNRTISGFDKVADNSNSNNDTNTNNDSILNDVLGDQKTKDQTHIFKGFYLEREVAAAIDRITAGKKKGVKSDLVNRILKNYLKEEGVM
jgi:hypothetical protein